MPSFEGAVLSMSISSRIGLSTISIRHFEMYYLNTSHPDFHFHFYTKSESANGPPLGMLPQHMSNNILLLLSDILHYVEKFHFFVNSFFNIKLEK